MMDAAPVFEDVFGALYRQARHVAWKLLGDQAQAEDAAAEAMARALAAWPKVGALPHREAWVMRVTANVAIDALRRRRATTLVPAADAEEDGVVVGLDVRRALVRLSRRQREVLVLRWIAGLSEEEVAGCLGLSRSSVRTHAARGLELMRQQLGGDMGYVAF